MKVALKELEPFIRDGRHLQTAKPFESFDGLRSREIGGNWLLCAAVNHNCGRERLTFSSDPRGGDGIIQDTERGATWDMEHVIVPASRDGSEQDAAALILEAIQDKQNKGGKAYASGKTLVVFSNARGGEWSPNHLGRRLPDPLDFAAVWVVALQGVETGEYVYGVTRLEREGSPVWHVHRGINLLSAACLSATCGAHLKERGPAWGLSSCANQILVLPRGIGPQAATSCSRRMRSISPSLAL